MFWCWEKFQALMCCINLASIFNMFPFNQFKLWFNLPQDFLAELRWKVLCWLKTKVMSLLLSSIMGRILSQWSTPENSGKLLRKVNIMELSHHRERGWAGVDHNTCCYTVIIDTYIFFFSINWLSCSIIKWESPHNTMSFYLSCSIMSFPHCKGLRRKAQPNSS